MEQARTAAVQRYLGARKAMDRAEADVTAIVRAVGDIARALEHWPRVHVTNIGAGFPKEVVTSGQALDARRWPTPAALAEALVAWHEAREAAFAAWDALPATARHDLPGPP